MYISNVKDRQTKNPSKYSFLHSLQEFFWNSYMAPHDILLPPKLKSWSTLYTHPSFVKIYIPIFVPCVGFGLQFIHGKSMILNWKIGIINKSMWIYISRWGIFLYNKKNNNKTLGVNLGTLKRNKLNHQYTKCLRIQFNSKIAASYQVMKSRTINFFWSKIVRFTCIT